MTRVLACALWLGLLGLRGVRADALFNDFNDTTGLVFNGDAATSNCERNIYHLYGDTQGNNDALDEKTFKTEYSENSDLVSELTIETNDASANGAVDRDSAGFLHRNDSRAAPASCSVRARLTPSAQSRKGSIWFREEVSVSDGFDTYFTFQITDQSKECTLHRDHYFSKVHHKSCSVRGGDGFAFVVQQSASAEHALGGAGKHMGFGGIDNSIAIAFDIWQNPSEDALAVDHVSVQSAGKGPNDANERGLLGSPRPAALADGKVHLVRIVYHNELQTRYLHRLVASPSLLPLLRGNGERLRVGTLSVFVDEGVASDDPLLCLPINLSQTLSLPADKAFVGFTAATGKQFAKHDVLSWIVCDQDPCAPALKSDFDFHQQSSFSSAALRSSVPYYP